MAAPPSIIDSFHKALFDVLAQDIDARMVKLAEGSAGDFAAYRYQVGYINALNDVLGVCRQIELDRYGSRPGSEAAE